MAQQTGPNPFIGRRGPLLGYRMAGKYYVRVISSLTAERVLEDPAFKLTMQCAGLLGKASKIASSVYGLLPQKEHDFYLKLTGMAIQMLKQGKTAEEAFEQLYNDHLLPLLSVEAPKQEQVSHGRRPGSFIHPKVEVCEQAAVSKTRLPGAVFRSRMEVSQRGQVYNNSFADELLKLVFSKPPEEQEMEKISVGNHPPSQPSHPPSRPLQKILSEPA
jgi:hypothetical protein